MTTMTKTQGLVRLLLGVVAAAVFLLGYVRLHSHLALWIAAFIYLGANVWFFSCQTGRCSLSW